jgi:hypothetical protein
MPTPTRVILETEFGTRNFLKILETGKGDLIISPRGMRHSVSVGEYQSSEINESEAVVTNITIHPNLKSEIGSISVNIKDKKHGAEIKRVVGLLGVKENIRVYPILASVGRNLSVPRLDYDKRNAPKGGSFELWEDNGIKLKSDSLAYVLAVCNKDLDINFPEDFPRNVKFFKFKHLKLVLFYWLFNQPTKLRGTSLRIDTLGEYIPGMEPHELLNLTNDLTMEHLSHYENFENL